MTTECKYQCSRGGINFLNTVTDHTSGHINIFGYTTFEVDEDVLRHMRRANRNTQGLFRVKKIDKTNGVSFCLTAESGTDIPTVQDLWISSLRDSLSTPMPDQIDATAISSDVVHEKTYDKYLENASRNR